MRALTAAARAAVQEQRRHAVGATELLKVQGMMRINRDLAPVERFHRRVKILALR